MGFLMLNTYIFDTLTEIREEKEEGKHETFQNADADRDGGADEE